jgi:hypothetical protein
MVDAAALAVTGLTKIVNVLGILGPYMDTLANSAMLVAGYFGVQVAGALVAAAASAFTLTGALVALRAALLATGIGALVIGAGYLITRFRELVEATGSWGAALEALGDLAEGVWDGIKTSAGSLVPALNAVWLDVQAGFMRMLSAIRGRWAQFLMEMALATPNIPGSEALSGALMDAAGRASAGAAGWGSMAGALSGQAEGQRGGVG